MNQVKEIFAEALERVGAERGAYLDQACGDHPELRAEVEELLLAAAQTEAFRETAAPILSERPGAMVGRYKLLEQIGEGGFGVVFMAEQETPVRRRVALKIIKLGMDTKQVIARFEAERQALAMMDHPSIAKVFDGGATDTGRPYFVMELVRGIPITTYCDQYKLSIPERLELFSQVCQAVQHAHQKGLIHRDIKPSNVLISTQDDRAVSKVIDFGIAKATQARLTEKTLFTEFRQMVGTPEYMSPEQADGGLDIDTRTDIYSLGVLLYELLAGSPPFDPKELRANAYGEMQRIIREVEPPAPSTRLSTMKEALPSIAAQRAVEPRKLEGILRGELDWIVMRCLEKDRKRRYETANGLARDIERYLADDPVEACPPSAAYRLRKFARRNRVPLAMGAVVTVGLLALVTALAVSNVLISRHSHAREVALREKSGALEVARTQEAAAVREQQRAEHESQLARHAGAQADARLFLQQRLLPAAIERATDAYRLGGQWEDGLLLHEIATAARRNWVLTARIPLSESPGVSCIVAAEPHPWLIVSAPDRLRVFDARAGTAVGTAVTAHPARHLFPTTQKSPGVLAVSDSDVTQLSLPDLAPQATRSFADPITLASASGSSLLLFHRSGTARIVKLPELSDVDSFVWTATEAIKQVPLPKQLAVSPDGMLALMHGGKWWDKAILWDRRAGAMPFTTYDVRAHRFQFIDNTRVVSCFSPDGPGEYADEAILYSFDRPAGPTTRRAGIFRQQISNDDIKGAAVAFQAWTNKFGVRVALAGMSGLVVTPLGSDLARISDRYANLMPHEPAPLFVALDAPSETLALAGGGQLLLFNREPDGESFNTRDYCATAFRDGLLYASWNDLPPKDVQLRLVPFDARRSPVEFTLQWLEDGIWLPWAMAATRDGSTIAVIAQETDRSNVVGSNYGRVRALIYHPRSLQEAGAWKLDQAIELNAPPATPGRTRFAALDPDARALVYWNTDATSVGRYDLRDGHLLGEMEFGSVAARSSDGSRAATVINDGRRLRVYEIATGHTVLDLPVELTSALCFTAEGSGVVAREEGSLVTRAIDSGKIVSSLSADLLPLAALPSANRLLAYQRDERGGGGSIVLADSSTGQVAYVLSRAGQRFTPAFFSESGRELAIVTDRWSAQVKRSLRPEELAGALDARFPQQDVVAALPPARIGTTAPLRAQLPTTRPCRDAIDPLTASPKSAPLGQIATIQGGVGLVTPTQAHNAMNIEFVGGDAHSVMVWFPPNVYAPLARALSRNPASILEGRTILVRGRVEHYGGFRPEWKDRLQVTVTDPHQFWIVTREGASDTTQPSTTHP